MTTKIVCRLLTADNQLLGWCEHQAAVRGDGCLRANGLVTIPVQREGVATCVSLHWADVNVETRAPITAPVRCVTPGMAIPVFADGQAMVTLGAPPVGLPAVTVGNVRIGVPVGQMGTKGMA